MRSFLGGVGRLRHFHRVPLRFPLGKGPAFHRCSIAGKVANFDLGAEFPVVSNLRSVISGCVASHRGARDRGHGDRK